MIISHEKKFIFFSYPKTGSESVRELLSGYSEEDVVDFKNTTSQCPFYSHIRPMETRDIFIKRGWDYSEYRKFMFVRNPWARMVSLYKMIKFRPFRPPFTWWLKSVKADGRGGGGRGHQRFRRYGTYSLRAYAGDESGSLLVDKIIPLENARKELSDYLGSSGLELEGDYVLPHVNKSNVQGDYREWYDPGSEGLVRSRYLFEIDMFGYRF